MELRDLHALVAVVETGSFTRPVELLHLGVFSSDSAPLVTAWSS